MFARTVKCTFRKTNILHYKENKFISTISEINSDITIIGGGIIGYSSAYWLKKDNPKLRIAIIEKENLYKECSTVLSVGGLRFQFSIPENIQMSLFGADVISNLEKYFSVGDEKVDIQFIKRGYLLLSSKNQENVLLKNYNLQKSLGASLVLLNKTQIKENWPWINIDDIEYGVYGKNSEGWFDPWLLLDTVRKKVNQLGVVSINGTLSEFISCENRLKYAIINLKDGQKMKIKFENVINASGCWANDIAVLAEHAMGFSGSEYPLFVSKVKRYVYNLTVPGFPVDIMTPMVIDSTGLYFRKENSGIFICGLSPESCKEPCCDDLEVDYEYFDKELWPKLYHRVSLMEALKVRSGWAGYYDYNTKDQNLIIGKHPAIENFYLCNGSSGHGIQHALAIGRANMELILYGHFKTINLERFHYNRFIKNELIFEENIF